MVNIEFVKVTENAKLPTKNHENDTGWDVYCVAETSILPGESKVVPIGLKMAYITPGFWIEIMCRSGLGFKHNLTVHHGVIDEGFRGSLDILVRNLDQTRGYTFREGDKVAQLVVHENYQTSARFTDAVTESARGEKGLGSSGK